MKSLCCLSSFVAGLALVFGVVSVHACQPDCSKGVRQLTADVVIPKVCLIADEAWSIESKSEVISSKIDNIHFDMHVSFSGDLSTVISKLDQIITEDWSIESKSEVISSKIDKLLEDGSTDHELWSIESKAEVISSKIDLMLPAVHPELWSIESKCEVISSKIDTVVPAIFPELWSIESKAEVISSKIDVLAQDCQSIPIFQEMVTYTITQPGLYCVAEDLTGNSPAIVVACNDVIIDLNGHRIKGGDAQAGSNDAIVVNGGISNITIQNGTIEAGTQGSGILLDGSSTGIKNVTVKNVFILNGVNDIDAQGVDGLTLEGVTASDADQAGVLLDSACTNIYAKNNMFINNNFYGFNADGASGIRVEGCLFNQNENNAIAGIYLHNARDVELISCAAQYTGAPINTGSNGFWLDSTVSTSAKIVLRDCTASDYANGFKISDVNYVTVTKCFSSGNVVNGFDITSTGSNGQVTLLNCNASGNGNYGFYNDDTYQRNRFYNNSSCFNGAGQFFGVSIAPVESPYNARGFDNVDCTLTTPDTVEVINSAIDTVVVPELWSIESKAEVISSKIDLMLPAVHPELWSIESKCEVISSKIDIPAPCALTPIITGGITQTNKQTITGPVTLTDSGDYCLSADVTGGDILISGNNITLDMNGYTVYNGTHGIDITGSMVDVLNGTIYSPAETGVRLRSAQCTLSSLDVINTKTGYLLAGAAYNQLNNCRALDCSRAGFSLENDGAKICTYNKLIGCQALNTGSSTNDIQTLSGFTSNCGYANTLDACSVNNVFNSKISPMADAQGINLTNEMNSQIIGCSVDGVATNTLSAYGIRLNMTVTATLADAGYVDSNNAKAIAWLDTSGTNRYLAIAYSTQIAPSVRVLKYDGTSLTSVATIPTTVAARSVAWTTIGENHYLAFTTISAPLATPEIFVYQFIEPNNLFSIASDNITQDINSCAWHKLGTATYLTVVGGGATEVRAYSFNGTVLTAAGTSALLPATGNAVDGIQYGGLDYVAAGDITNALCVYTYNGAALTPLSGAPFVLGNPIQSVKWLTTDHSLYLAIAGGTTSGNYVNVYAVTFPANVPTFNSTPIASYNHGAQVNSVSWLPSSPIKNYLAIGGNASGTDGATARVLEFNGTSLTQDFSYTSGTTNGVDWFGPFLAIAQNVTGGIDAHALKCGNSCLNCVVDSNTVTNVRGAGSSGIGYAVISLLNHNLFISNIGYNNDTNFFPEPDSDNGNNGF